MSEGLYRVNASIRRELRGCMRLPSTLKVFTLEVFDRYDDDGRKNKHKYSGNYDG